MNWTIFAIVFITVSIISVSTYFLIDWLTSNHSGPSPTPSPPGPSGPPSSGPPSSCPPSQDPACKFGYKTLLNSNIDLDLQNYASRTVGNYCVCNACVPPEGPSKKYCDKSCDSTEATPYIHMCPRMMLGSPLMIQAQQLDAKQNPNIKKYNYAVVGHDLNKELDPGTPEETCGQCYEIIFKDPNVAPLIAQAFNTAATGPQKINFDIYMPVGGYGAFNSIINDSNFTHTTKTKSFAYKAQPTISGYSYGALGGGLRGSLLYSNQEAPDGNGCSDKVNNYCITKDDYKEKCQEIKGNDSNQTKLVQSACEWVFNNNYHWNHLVEKVRRVQCPENLSKVTGLKRLDTSLPIPGEGDNGWITASSSLTIGTTTMEDGCKPTCSNIYAVKGSTLDTNYNVMYSCDKNGNVFVDN